MYGPVRVVLVHNSDHVKTLDVGDAMERDHIPPSAALQRVKEIELGRD